MQATILERVAAADDDAATAVGSRGGVAMRVASVVLAAAALVALGCWWGMGSGAESVWTRPPMAATPTAFEEPKAVPYSGPRAPLRLLGTDVADNTEVDGQAQGLRARDELRSLVDDNSWLPPRHRRQR